METKIITDSTTDLPAYIIEKYDIDLIPVNIRIDDQDYLDKVNIEIDDLYEYIKQGIFPKTSLPSPGRIYDRLEAYAKEGRDFIFYTFSSKLAGTYPTCMLIVNELKEKYKNVNMKVIDSLSGSFGSGIIVWQAALLAKKGCSFDEIIKQSLENIKYIEHIFTLDDLSGLIQGGRLSRASAIVAGVLQIKPILHLKDGQISVINKIRGRNKSLRKLADLVVERIGKWTEQTIGIAHAADLDIALKTKSMLKERIKDADYEIIKIGGGLASHLGIGGVGVFFLNKEPNIYIRDN